MAGRYQNVKVKVKPYWVLLLQEMTMEAVVTTRSPRRAKTSGQITATTSIPTYIQRFTGSCRLSYRPIYSVKAWNAIKLFSNSVTATAGMLRITDNVAMSSTLD